MNKIKSTKKEMRMNYRIASIGYVEAQHLLYYKSPFAYTCGVNGWSADYYDIKGVLISTGYDPIASKNTNCNYALVREYDDLAKKADTIAEIDVLLGQFIKEITTN